MTTSSDTPTTGRSAEIEIRCPADGRTVGSVPDMGEAEVAAMASRLRAAQPEWQALGPRKRAEWLLRWNDWVLDNKRHLQEIVQLEGGKSWGDASIEPLAVTQTLRYAAANGPAALGDDHPRAVGLPNVAKKLRVRHHPYPLVGVISPWNYPLAMPMFDTPFALVAGCAVLSKPSEVTPLAWVEAVKGWSEIGAPPVLDVATGGGAAGAAVVDVVDMVQFTGSTATGRRIGARAGERLIPCSLELGGKDPMIVLADADLERAANGAVWGGLFNAGQSCTAIERVYVEAPVYDRFVEVVTEKVAAMRQGMDEPGSFRTDIGALATQSQLDLVSRHVDEALAGGARATTGGRAAGEGFLYEPTVLVDVDQSMACVQEETFGPVLPIIRVADADEAVRLANDTVYGLSASIWTKDADRADALADRLRVGAVNVNNCMINVFQFPLPHSGWQESGVGSRFGGAKGFLKFCRDQAYVTERVEPSSELLWYPYTARVGGLMGKMVNLLAARDWRRRLRG
ncbi:aldehyde dehydrogenase family protein [Actinomycetospora sp. TBRC 11914]|uniref:aldehyde dehydrogenase family protein n=1 Tax=Actinomycetospora sp. TBRC 11914 TaxID=2729387 RepID=UPI00145C4C51|nr:aldehyde dehydrogenase family protein [Actinomycetospora sp. TBRC 11914]NMO91668.1 aldehyde dehydrogenase family protein [Actinomycetospora sp. TBRC 11914]